MMGLRGESMNPMTFGNMIHPNIRVFLKAYHILPECALGYKKIDHGMVTFPMILDDFWTRKKVSPKYSPTSFQNIAIFQIYRWKIEMNLKIGQLRNDFSAF